MLCDDGKELLEGEINESGEGGRASSWNDLLKLS